MDQEGGGRTAGGGVGFHIVALAASAGGLDAIARVLHELPEGFPAAILVIQHLDPRRQSQLAAILDRRTALPVSEATDGQKLRPGTVSIAPPDRHLVVNSDGTLSLTHTEVVHYLRPSAEVLFESLAANCASRAIAVVLTGTGADGSTGARDVKAGGGRVLVQDPAEAEHAGMPEAAIATGAADQILPLMKIPRALLDLVGEVESG